MKLKINGEDLELVYSFRINLYYEEISGKSLDLTDLGANDLMNLFFSTVYASLQKAKRPAITMLEFLDVIDDNGGEKTIVEFSKWYIEQMKAQYEILPEEDKKEVSEKKED